MNGIVGFLLSLLKSFTILLEKVLLLFTWKIILKNNFSDILYLTNTLLNIFSYNEVFKVHV